jgi:CDP-glucose 4,6-dehydratase
LEQWHCSLEGVVMNRQFWQGKRVFLTGHTGFKGSWLSLWLKDAGADLTGYALRPPTNPSLFDVAGVALGMRSIIGDIRDAEVLEQAVRSAKPEIIIHMAAQPLVRYSYQAPVETYATNVMGTVHLLDAIRRAETVRAVVNVTSDKCYANMEWPWGYRENDPMGGYDPYSSSKGCAELVTAAFRNSYFNAADYTTHYVAIASARAGNVIGGGDWAMDRIIPDVLRAIEAGNPVKLRSPKATRPWQHVLEPLCGYLTLAEKLYSDGPAYADGWNFGPTDEDVQSVQHIIEKLTSSWGGNARWCLDEHPLVHEAKILKLDCSKARLALQWSPRWRLNETINKITEWHKAYLAGDNMAAITLRQIHDYEASTSTRQQ